MADNITLNSGTGGATLAADDVSSVWYQQVKLVDGTLDSTTVIAAGGGVEAGALRVTLASDSTGVVSVDDNGGALTVDWAGTAPPIGAGVEATALRVTLATDSTGVVSVDDNGANLSVDWAGTVPPIGAGTEAAALRVTVATDSTGVLSVDDGGGALTVDNAGTFAVQVDGSALTALQLIDDSIFADDAAFTLTSSKVTVSGAIRDDALGTLTAIEGDAVPLRVSSTGALHVTGGGGGTEYNEDDATPATIVGTATLIERDDALSTLTPIEGDWVGLRSNARGALWVELDLTNDVTIADGGNSITVDNGGTFTTQATLQTGSALVGDVGLSGARTSGGTTLYKNIDVDESEDQVKGTAGQVYWVHAMNLASGVRHLKFYNATAASVTVGTTVPDLTFPIPTQGDTNGAGFTLEIPNGIAFGTAITVAATTGVADNDSGAPGANEVVINLGYA